MHRLKALTLTVAATLAIAACGASGGQDAAPTTTAAPTTAAPDTTEAETTTTEAPTTTEATTTTAETLTCQTCTTEGEEYLFNAMPEILEDRCNTEDPTSVIDIPEAAGSDGAWECTFSFEGSQIAADYIDFPDYASMEAYYEAVISAFSSESRTWNVEGEADRVGLFTTFDEPKDGGVVWSNLIWTYDDFYVLVWAYTEDGPDVVEAWWDQLPLPDLGR